MKQYFCSKNKITFKVALAILLFSAFVMKTMGSEYFSPFISSPQDTMPALNQWARCCFSNDQMLWFFIADVFFALSLLIIHVQLLFRVDERNRFYKKLAIGLSFLALGADLTETYFFYFGNSNNFDIVQAIKLFFYASVWVQLIYLTIKCLIKKVEGNKDMLEDFFKNYLPYFYPSILSIIILFFAFNAMDQFDALFVELPQCFNFILFCILFLGTILKVWFTPYYLQFTDRFYDFLPEKLEEDYEANNKYKRSFIGPKTKEEIEKEEENRQKKWKEYGANLNYKGIYQSVKKIIAKSIGKKNNESQDNLSLFKSNQFSKIKDVYKNLNQGQEISPEIQWVEKEIQYVPMSTNENKVEIFFHNLRKYIGLIFILILFSLLLDAVINVYKLYRINTTAVTLIIGFCLFQFLFWVEKLAEDSANRWKIFNAFVIASVTFLTLIFHTIDKYKTSSSEALIWFSVTTLISAITFILLAVFRDPQSEKNKKTLVGTTQEIITNFLLKYQFGFPIIMGVVLLGCLIDLNLFKCINPVNFYLIFANGIVCLIAVLDRFIKIKVNRQAFKEAKKNEKLTAIERKTYYTPYLAFIITSIMLIVVLRQMEDVHHEVNYYQAKPEIEKPLSFEKHTQKFLENSDPDKPIFLITAEGGGLRAAYWTMLVLDTLDQKDFWQQTFLMSGASGGAIGQGMYNYMKTQDGLKEVEKSSLINEMGNENFLTTDMAGIFSRAWIGSIAPFPFMKKYGDRHYYMAKRYFELISPNNWNSLEKQPFHQLWLDNQMPLIIVNTTSTEDGSRAVVQPFSNENSPTFPYQNISQNNKGANISYPHAVFLTNRFPVASPAARVESEGHFVDGGYFENSGIQTVLQVLSFMQSKGASNPIYQEFLARKIVLINIQNSKDTYAKKQLRDKGITQQNVNRILPKGEISSIISAAANGGMTALPEYYNLLLEDTLVHQVLGLNKVRTISLPHFISQNLPHQLFFGQIETENCELNQMINEINEEIESVGNTKVLMPPLGRMMTKETTKYMEDMLNHPEPKENIDFILEMMKE